MVRGYARAERVKEVIREEISTLLLREIKDPRIGFITITDVEVSEDLRVAHVYFTIHGGKEEKEKALEGLERAKGFMRRALGKRLRLKRVPDLVFSLDESLEYGERIEALIERIKRGG